ncbi:putative peroxidase [Aspergillus homomorphus CBS 101889]|uniref:Putative peroxidase n=1 Tax=Aspergillus homomorphus (strain CBS 101889) TaxID=1450537 RepID=A0A395I986_ASPHC|nr:putative peroxidase [Aspergillus homomorphus CBS 101889]RAL16830.1 putative peroxidase [Aspergillus homomorphus CBS 101889]
MVRSKENTDTNTTTDTDTFRPAAAGDARSPCPVLNSLANHNRLPHDGRNITAPQLRSALGSIGLGADLSALLVWRAFTIHNDDAEFGPHGSIGGLRDAEDVTADGVPVLHLDKVGRPHAIEHDVSVTRQDRALGDPIALDPALYEQFLASTPHRFGVPELGRYRKVRYAEQAKANPDLKFERREHYIACGELAVLRCLFGEGVFKGIPKEYLEALFGEERLPLKEGWRPRTWVKAFLPEAAAVILAISRYAWPF